MVDQVKLGVLLDFLDAERAPADKTPLVTIAQFFDGNDQDYSFAANMFEHPGLTKARHVLERINAHPEVASVRIAIIEYYRDGGEWPYSDTILVIGELNEEELADMLTETPDMEIWTGTEERYHNLPNIPEGMTLFNAFSD
jgi:hypothetical protein